MNNHEFITNNIEILILCLSYFTTNVKYTKKSKIVPQFECQTLKTEILNDIIPKEQNRRRWSKILFEKKKSQFTFPSHAGQIF